MFENKEKKTELMIVCEEKTNEYANYLMALIGQKDDVDDQIIGTRDESVTAAIYTPKQYKDNLPKITPNLHILFIGNFKEAKDIENNIAFKFDKYGMRYGWIGKRAVMNVEGTIDKVDYEQFRLGVEGKLNNLEEVKIHRIVKIAKWLLIPGAWPLAIGAGIEDAKVQNKLKKQRYRYLTLKFYLDGLQEFLED